MKQNQLDNNNIEHIKVDPYTGTASVHVPITRLVANNRQGPTFDVEFFHRGGSDSIHMAMTHIVPSGANLPYQARFSDGSSINFGKKNVVTPSFVIEVDEKADEIFIYHREGTVEKFISQASLLAQAAGETTGVPTAGTGKYVLDSITSSLGRQMYFVWRVFLEESSAPKKRAPAYACQLFEIKDEYRTLLRFDESTLPRPSLMTVYPDSPKDLHESFSYNLYYEYPDATDSALLNDKAETIDLYDGKSKVTTKLKPSDLRGRINSVSCATGYMPYMRTFNYTQDSQIDTVTVQLSKFIDKENLVSSSEKLTWSLGKVKTLVRSRGMGLADETLTYTYAAEGKGARTTVEASGLINSKTVRSYNAEGRLTKETVSEGGKTRVTEQKIRFDKARGVSVGESLIYNEGAAESEKEKVKWEMDTEGNLMMLEEDGIRTDYTYCTTMHFYKSTFEEIEVKLEFDWASLLSPAIGAYRLFDYVTSHNQEIRAIHHVAKPFQHESSVLGLPLPLHYPGDPQLFDRYLESEVTRKVDREGNLSSEGPLRARWYSYSGLKPLKQVGKALTDGQAPVLEYVITVLNPLVSSVDTFDARVEATIESIGVMGTVLKKYLSDQFKSPYRPGYTSNKTLPEKAKYLTDLVNGLDEKSFKALFAGLAEIKPSQETELKLLVDNLQKRLDGHIAVFDQQVASKTNALKLTKQPNLTVDNCAVSIEKTTYSSNKDSYGLPATVEVYALDNDFKEVSDSKLTTTFTYQYDAKRHEFKTDTVLKAAGSCETGDVSICSASTGKVLRQTTDTAQILHNMPFVNITTDSVSYLKIGDEESATPQSKVVTTHVYENDHYHRDETNGGNQEIRRTTFDLLGRQTGTFIIRTKDNKSTTSLLSSTTYDDRGRICEYSLYDYVGSAEGLKLFTTYSVTWTYGQDGITVLRKLSDAQGKELDSETEVQATDEQGVLSITRGGMQFKKSVNPDSRTVAEFQWDGKTHPFLITESSYDSWGAVKKINYVSVGENGEGESLLCQDIERDRDGRPIKVKQTSGKDTKPSEVLYTYDSYGRTRLIESAGVKVENVYPASTPVAVALSASISENDKLIKLGTQKHDGFGRVTEETPTGVPATTFGYVKGSRWGRQSGIDPAKRIPVMDDFSSTLDLGNLEYSESCDGLTSKSVYSLQGRLVSFTDIAGNVTTMSYDVNGRFKKINTDKKAETVFEYRADGLLLKETVKDLVSKKTMVVTYTYNLMGYETSRTFACDGFSTLAVERTLLADGRLKKSTLKVAGVERRSDNYSYQDCGRLDTWSCTGEDAPTNHNDTKYLSQKFTYDVLGNVTQRTNKTSGGDTVSTYSYSNTIPGVLTKSGSDEQKNDIYGRLTQRSSRQITYYDSGQVKTYNSGASGSSGLYTFSYDDFGCIRDLRLGADYRETYHYRGNQMYGFQQLEDNGNKVRGYHDRIIVLLNDSPSCYLQQISTTKEVKGKAVVTTSFELRDAAGSIFASYDLSTQKVSYFTYSPYGYRNPQPSSPTWLGFKGEPLNAVSLYHLGRGYRLYDPQLHRFQSPDSWSPFGRAGANEYCYCCSDPVNNHDPSGHLVEVWSDRRSQPSIWDDNWQLIVNGTITLASIALAPFSGGASVALRLASLALATAIGALTVVSYKVGKTHPNLAAAIDLALILSGRAIGAKVAAMARRAFFVGRATAFKSIALAERRSMRMIDRMDDGLDLSALGMWSYGVGKATVSASDTHTAASDQQTLRAQWNSPFLTRPDVSGRQHLVDDDDYLAMTHVDQFLKKSPPLRDAIARAWGSDEKLDVVKVMKDYINTAGTNNMLNQSPLSSDHKVLHDMAMYGLIHNDPDGMYCRGNSVSIISDLVGEGFTPFEQKPDLAL